MSDVESKSLIARYILLYDFMFLWVCRHMLNVTWERKDLSFNNQGFLSNPSMVIIALDRDRLWDKVLGTRNWNTKTLHTEDSDTLWNHRLLRLTVTFARSVLWTMKITYIFSVQASFRGTGSRETAP